MSSKKDNKKEQLSKQELKEQKQQKKNAKKAEIAAMSVKQRKKYYLKNAVIIVGICFAALLVLCFAFWLISLLLSCTEKEQSEVSSIPESRIINIPYEHPTYPAFAVDFDKNVYENETYTELNLDLTYEEKATEFVYTLDKPVGAEHEGHRFFKKYFEMLRSGDYEIYPSLFAQSYIPETSYEQDINRIFPPQMVYDVKIDEHSRVKDTYDGKSCVRGIYTVNYRIFENDLYFRRDIGYDSDTEKDVARALIFELITFNCGKPDEETYIHNIYTETSPQNQQNAH